MIDASSQATGALLDPTMYTQNQDCLGMVADTPSEATCGIRCIKKITDGRHLGELETTSNAIQCTYYDDYGSGNICFYNVGPAICLGRLVF